MYFRTLSSILFLLSAACDNGADSQNSAVQKPSPEVLARLEADATTTYWNRDPDFMKVLRVELEKADIPYKDGDDGTITYHSKYKVAVKRIRDRISDRDS